MSFGDGCAANPRLAARAAGVLLAGLSGVVIGAPPPCPPTCVPECPPLGSEIEVNNTFAARTILMGANTCHWSMIYPCNRLRRPATTGIGDVDFFQIRGLRPNAPYYVETRGQHQTLPRTLDTLLRQYNAGGAPGPINDDIGLSGVAPFQWWNRNSALVMQSDAAGNIYFAVTGWADFNDDGIDDITGAPHQEEGDYQLVVQHSCSLGCYDLNMDCVVNATDLALLLGSWGGTCP